VKILKDELVGPNPYDRIYTIDPHDDCTGEGCGDVATFEFHKGQWTINAINAPSVVVARQ